MPIVANGPPTVSLHKKYIEEPYNELRLKIYGWFIAAGNFKNEPKE